MHILNLIYSLLPWLFELNFLFQNKIEIFLEELVLTFQVKFRCLFLQLSHLILINGK